LTALRPAMFGVIVMFARQLCAYVPYIRPLSNYEKAPAMARFILDPEILRRLPLLMAQRAATNIDIAGDPPSQLSAPSTYSACC
jgi:hypothetical protein